MGEQAKVFHYECETRDRYFLMTDKGTFKFIGGQYATDSEKDSKLIEASKAFKSGKIWRSSGVIVNANRGKVTSGARGTNTRKKSLTPQEKIQEMREMGVPQTVIARYEEELAAK